VVQRPPHPVGDHLRRLDLLRRQVQDAQRDALPAQRSQRRRVQVRLRGLDRDRRGVHLGQLWEHRVALGPVGDHRGVAEADVHVHRAGSTGQRRVQHLHAVPPGHLGPGLQPRLVELDDVGAGGEQVGDLCPDDLGVGQRERPVVAVVVVLRLLGHGERARDGDLHGAVGRRPQELHVGHLHR
jgi:hypothetical protein